MKTTRDRRFYFSVDVDWVRGSEAALPEIFALCDEYDLRATFFAVGGFAEEYPELLAEAVRRGHEVGTHGWLHGLDNREDYRTATWDEQHDWVTRATNAVERATGVRPRSFRAPNLWVGETTLEVLEALNYAFDSSVPARRFDAGFGRLGLETRYWRAPREPYHPLSSHLGRKGDSSIIEVPPSTFFLPMNMSGLRMFGVRALAAASRLLALRTDILVFYIHPWDFVPACAQALGSWTPRRHVEGIGRENFGPLRQYLDVVAALGFRSLRVDQTRLPEDHLAMGTD